MTDHGHPQLCFLIDTSAIVTEGGELDRLPDSHSDSISWNKVDQVNQHIYDGYHGSGRGVYVPLSYGAVCEILDGILEDL